MFGLRWPQTIDHLSSSSSAFCCRLHLSPEAHHPYVSVYMLLPGTVYGEGITSRFFWVCHPAVVHLPTPIPHDLVVGFQWNLTQIFIMWVATAEKFFKVREQKFNVAARPNGLSSRGTSTNGSLSKIILFLMSTIMPTTPCDLCNESCSQFLVTSICDLPDIINC